MSQDQIFLAHASGYDKIATPKLTRWVTKHIRFGPERRRSLLVRGLETAPHFPQTSSADRVHGTLRRLEAGLVDTVRRLLFRDCLLDLGNQFIIAGATSHQVAQRRLALCEQAIADRTVGRDA